jgi:starvation-inducible DNA-binding protein
MSKDMVNTLNLLVADMTVFYQKLRHYHWNVKGPEFFRLHEKFELIYTEVGDVIDALAERIVGLDGVPLHTLAAMLDATSLKEDSENPEADVMVKRTIKDIEVLAGKLQAGIETAEDAVDRTTANLLDEVKDGLEAHLWMLKAWQA